MGTRTSVTSAMLRSALNFSQSSLSCCRAFCPSVAACPIAPQPVRFVARRGVEGTHQVQPHRQRHPQQLGRRAGRVGAAPPVRDEDRERAVPPRPRRRRATEIRQLHPSRERVLRPDRERREEGVEPPIPLTNYRTHSYYATPPSPASASSNTVSYAFASTHTWVSSAPATHVTRHAPST